MKSVPLAGSEPSPDSGGLRREWPALALVGAAVAGLYGFFPYFQGYLDHRTSVFWNLWFAWNHADQGEWFYGMFIPFLCLWLGWRERAVLAALPARPSRWGAAAIGAALFFYWLGYAADIAHAANLSILLLAAGLILWFRGVTAFRVLLFPWAFLVFMFPMAFLDNLIGFPLRMIMAQGAHGVLGALGVANVRTGTAIVSAPDYVAGFRQGALFAVDVADPCSGIRSLFVLVMLSALYGHFTLEGPWRRAALVLAAVPLAVAANMVRIILITFAILLWGAPFAVGTAAEPSAFHEGAGFLVLILALLGFLPCERLLRSLGRKGPPKR